jgi:alpha-D-xyloside xylohydrolase
MQKFRQQNNSLYWQNNYHTLLIEPWGCDSLRVRSTISANIRDDVFSILLPPPDTRVQVTIGEERATISNGAISAHVSSEGWVRFFNTISGAELLSELKPLHSTRVPSHAFKALEGDLFHLEARFQAYDGERFYGLGQHQHGRLDQKGCVIELIQRNTEVTIPFLFSNRGYGFLWHNPAVGRVELGHSQTCWVAEAAPQLDYWITTGTTSAEIMEHYADATGHPSEFPTWAAGFWQSKLRYHTQEELMAVAREYKQRGLPLSVIVIDFFHWTLFGDWRFEPEEWPDPAGMVRELQDMGITLMVSVWPTINPLSENFSRMVEQGLLLRTGQGPAFLMSFQDKHPQGPVYLCYYDATNPDARQFIWDQVREHYYQYGIKAWWLDACEPEMYLLNPDDVRFHLGTGLAVANAYPLLHARGFYEHMHDAGETTILNLSRSAWAGSQRYGVAVWSGDIDSTFEALQTQVRSGLNMSLSGIPWWTTDIGGFYGGVPASPTFRELIVRWFQYSAFCPLFRLHGFRYPSTDSSVMIDTGETNEAWSFGEEAYAIIKELLFLRERLRPYIMAQMQQAHEKGIPPMRPLFFDFPEDETCTRVDDQYLLGPDLLVAPVLVEGMRQRQVYLPQSIKWTDAWSGQIFAGGQYIMAEAPLAHIPLYLRADTKLPIRTEMY